MNIIHLRNIKKDNVGAPLFTGTITRQSPMATIEESDLSIDYVHFPKGIRNKLHAHSNGQVLIVTKGSGIIATKSRQCKVKAGDIIWIPTGEFHWHGANADSDFTHISVTKAKSKITQAEK